MSWIEQTSLLIWSSAHNTRVMIPCGGFSCMLLQSAGTSQGLAKRVIACLDVRANDAGDLVVTKGDQYDVRDKGTAANDVRNLGLPVQLAGRYFVEGADEVTFLNITGFRDFPLGDLPMLQVTSFHLFHSIPYSLGCGASCDSSDILA